MLLTAMKIHVLLNILLGTLRTVANVHARLVNTHNDIFRYMYVSTCSMKIYAHFVVCPAEGHMRVTEKLTL